MAFLQKTFRNTVLLLTSLFVLAFAQNAKAQCAFNNLEWEVQDCVNGTFYLTFSFTNPTPSEDGFAVWKDFPGGYFVGLQSYGASSYTVGPFEGDGSTFYQFTLYDYSTNGCEGNISVGQIDCPASNECSLFASAQQSDCFEGGQFQWMFYINQINGTVDEGYTLYNTANEVIYVAESYNDFPFIEAQSNGVGETVIFTIVDNNNPACQYSFSGVDLGCSLCEIEINSAVVTECNEEGDYFVEFSVSQVNSLTGQFLVSASYNFGEEFGPFDYGQDSYIVGPLVTLGPENFINARDVDTEPGSCYDSFTLGEINCVTEECILEITSATPTECFDGQFFVNLEITAENGFSDAFNLVIGNDMFNGLPYGLGIYTVGPVSQNNNGIYQVGVYDPANDTCNDGFEFVLECEDTNTCNLDVNYFSEAFCVDGQIYITIGITAENPISDNFTAVVGDEIFNGLEYESEFHTLGPINSNDSGNYELFVYDSADESCNIGYGFSSDCVEITDCSLVPSNFAPVNCTGSEVYFIGSIESDNTGSQGFTVLLNGENYGTYEYEAINYEFGPFPYFSGEEYVFEFIDNEVEPSCAGTYTYPAFEIENCSGYCLVNLDALEVTECNADGEFFLNIQVSTSPNSPSTSFTAFVGSTEQEFGPFEYGQEVYTIGPLTPDGTENDYLIVQDASDVEGCGGHELLFSDPDCGLNFDCAIEFNSLEVGECDENGQFMLDFQVNVDNPASGSFRVYINDENWSYQFTYTGADTYSIGPFNAADGVFNLMIHDTLDDECTANATIDAPSCESEECGFNDITLDFQGCNEEVGTMFLVDFNAVGTGDIGFDVFANGEFLSFHLYADMPVTINIPAQPGNFAVLDFCDNDNPNCCTQAFADVVNCDETGECGLGLNGAQFTECEDGSFNIFVPTINTFGVLSETFDAYINGVFVGNYPYDQEDWLFGPVTLDGETPLVLSITDSENETCPASLFFGTPNPCGNTPDCEIAIPAFELYECNDEGQIYVDFEVTGLEIGAQFSAFGNGQEYGPFTFGEAFYTIGPFVGNGSAYEFIIGDLLQDFCVGFIDFDTPVCETEPTCQINIPFIEVGECDADGQFFVNFEMLPVETNSTVEITGNGQNYGIYDYNLPLYTVGPFDGTETATYELIVTDTENPECVQVLTFASANCNAQDCNMSLTFDEYANCFGDNQYYVIVSVTNGNVEEGSFTFVGNGEFYGTEEYGAGSYAVGPFDGGGDLVYELLAIDNQDETCSVELVFEGQECETEPTCELEITFIENYECNEDAQFYFDFGVSGIEAGEEFYAQITGQEDVYFTGGEGFYTLGPVNGDGTNYGLTVYSLQDEECSVSSEIDAQNCLDNFPCGFNNISTQYNDCFEDGAYLYTLDFTPVNTTNEFFDIIINGETSFYPYSSLPIDLILPASEDLIGTFTICDNDNPDCCQEVSIDLPECEAEICSLEVIEYELTDCDEIGNFYVDFSVSVVNPTSEVFYAFHNGTIYGPFEFGQDSYQIGPLDGFETAIFEILIYVEGNAECASQIVFDSANCNGTNDCSLEIFELEFTDCDDEGLFFVNFAVEANNPNAATFVVTGNGENYGTFEYGQDFYTVGPFDGNLDPVWELIITDTENGECNNFVSFVSPGCNLSECNLDNVGAIELSSCNDAGQFYVDILILVGSTGEGSFSVFGNGETYGTFEYGEEFYTVGPFIGDGASTYELVAVDNANEECTYAVEFDAPDCSIAPVCNLEVVEYLPTECNEEGEFFVDIYLTEGSFGSTFQVFNNDESFGPFEYGADVYTVGPFPSWEGAFNLELYDTGFDQCFDVIFVEEVDCPVSDCFIENLEVATGECNDENTYSITINFFYNDVGGEFFNLIYQDEIIGTYETASLPITIENFEGNAEVETLTVCMADFEDCCASIDFLTPQCEGLITWPGDGNFDGITNNMDILNMGIAYGFTGPARVTDNVGWDAQDAFAWEENFVSGVNYVHADADGNGEVEMADAEIVELNYDLTHDEVTPFEEMEGEESSPALFVDMPDPFELQQGMQFNAPIIFGLEDLPVQNVYGLAFTLRYDPEIIDPSSILLEYPVSWLGFPQTNLMTFDYHDIDLGEIDVAITKIDQNNVSGWGEILNFIGIIDNIAGKTEIFIEIANVNAILSNEERFAVNTPLEITTITSTKNVNELQGFELFPNPTNDIIHIKNETGLSLQSIQISDLNGKVLRNVNAESAIDLSDLASGVYMARVVFDGRSIHRRIVKL